MIRLDVYTWIVVISVALAIVPVVVSVIKGRFDFLTPAGIFALGFSASYTFKAWLIFQSPMHFVTYPDRFRATPETMYQPLILSWAGLAMFYAGYYAMHRVPVNVFPALHARRAGLRFAYFASATGVLLGVLSLLAILSKITGQIGEISLTPDFANRLRNELMLAWNQHPMFFHFPVYIGFFALMAIHARKALEARSGWRISRRTTFVIAAAAIVVMVLFGGRAILLSFLLALVLYRHYYVRRVRFLKQTLFLVIIAFSGAILGVIQKINEPAGQQALELGFPWGLVARLSSSYEQFETLVYTIDANPPMEWGRTFFEDVFITYIPRRIWPGKPTDFGFLRAQNVVFADYFSASRNTTYPIGILGELYLNFGVLGIVFGMFIAGTVVRQMEIRAAHYASPYPAIFVTLVSDFIAPQRTYGTMMMIIILYLGYGALVFKIPGLFERHDRRALADSGARAT